MIDVSILKQLITALQAESQKDAITPYSLGELLHSIADLLATAFTDGDYSDLREAIANETTARQDADTSLVNAINSETETRASADSSFNTILTKVLKTNPLGSNAPLLLGEVALPIVDVADIDNIPATRNVAMTTAGRFPTEYLVANMQRLIGRLFVFADSMSHAFTQVLITHELLKEDGTLDPGSHADPLFIYFRRYNLAPVHGTVGQWSQWKEYIPVHTVERLNRNVYDLGTMEQPENAFIAAEAKEIATDANISLIRFCFDNGSQNGTIFQQVGNMVHDNTCETTQFFVYDGFCSYRTISWYYEADGSGHNARDIKQVSFWQTFLGSKLAFDSVTHKLSLMDIRNNVLSEVPLPVTLQSAWDTGSEHSYIYSKKWVSGADNSRSVLAAGTTLGQQAGKLKMRYVFWGGGGGKVYENIIPTATTTADGVMSAADKAALEDLKNRVAALEAR